MSDIVLGVSAVVIGYLLGSIPPAYIIARLCKGVDIREVDTGNVGTASTLRTIGVWQGFVVGFVDVAKGFAAILIAQALGVALPWMLGAGFAANGWQSMLAKIIPSDARGTFFGLQAALANIFISMTAVAAGFILVKLPDRSDFAVCFLLTLGAMGLSMLFLGLTREPVDEQKIIPDRSPAPWKDWWPSCAGIGISPPS